MTTLTDTLHPYYRIAGLTSKQLLAAQSGDWETLAALELDSGRIIEMIKHTDCIGALSLTEQEELSVVLDNTLKDHQKICKLAEEGRRQLSAQMKSIKIEQKILQVYGLS